MNCAEFARWLDEGMDGRPDSGARQHASGCSQCAGLLHAQREIESLLGHERAVPLPDSSSFVERVMVEVAAAGRPVARPELWPAMSPLPWWVQAAADPAAVLACALVALLLWRPDAFSQATRFASERWSILAWPAIAWARSVLGLDRPAVALGLGILGVLLLGWISLQLYRWTERLTRRSAGA